jgi:hypothetical protein
VRKRKQTEIDRQALVAPKRNWTLQEDDVIERYYGAERLETIQRRILKETGSPRTMAAIVIRATRHLGLDHRTAPGEFTVAEAAEALGVKKSLLYRRIGKGLIKSTGRGKCLFIPAEEMERLEQEFPKPPERSMTKREAMRVLGYGESHITRLLIAGAIRGVKRGDRWFVDADHVAELIAEFRRTGATRREWGDLPYLEEQRAKAREYARTVRNPRRAAENAERKRA